MVNSSENKNTASLHDLTDYAIAKQVLDDFPKVMMIYDKLLPALDKYQHYLAVSSVMMAVEDAQTLMRMQMEQFESIHKSRGKVTDDSI